MADNNIPTPSVTNPNFISERTAEGLAITQAVNIGLTDGDAYDCLEQFPPTYFERGIGYYGTYQFQKVVDCLLQKAMVKETKTVINGLKSLDKQVSDGLNGVANSIVGQLSAADTAIADIIDGVAQGIADAQYAMLDDTYVFTDTVRQFFVAAAQQFAGAVNQSVEAIQDTLRLIQVQNTNDVYALTQTIRDIFIVQSAAQTDLLESFAREEASSTEVLQGILELLRENLEGKFDTDSEKQLSDMILELGELTASNPEAILHDVLKPLEWFQQAGGGFLKGEGLPLDFLTGMIPGNKFMGFLLTAIAVPFVLKDMAAAALIPYMNRLAQDNAAESPFALLPTEIITRLRVLGIIDEQRHNLEMKRAGYDQERINLVMRNTIQLIPPAELINWWLRELISDDDLLARLRQHGLRDEDTELIKEAAFFIPPVGDLVTMAVREVFDESIASTFGQFEDFPADFALWATKHGVSEDWAKRYWAAHWGLPSPNQGFEMFQRRIINREELEKLMKAQDIMPFWRDRMIQLAYNPLTRVDVRRMHLLGILSEDDVYNSYLDIGYSPENAKALTLFTTVYNEEVADLGSAREIARDQIMQLFTKGVISREEAKELLLNLKYTEQDAELLITLTEINNDTKYREAQIDLIQAKTKAGTLTFEKAQEALTALGVTQIEMANALAAITTVKTQQTAIPSLTDLRAMHRSNALSDEEFRRWLQELGYNEFWQSRYIMLGRGKDNG